MNESPLFTENIQSRNTGLAKDLTLRAMRQVDIVLPGLLIGSESNCMDAVANGCISVSVRHVLCPRKSCTHIPILDMTGKVIGRRALDLFADWLHINHQLGGNKVYVHCFHGIERAPLAVSYYIKRYVLPGVAFKIVYAWVRKQRSVAIDRSEWLEPELLKELAE